MRDDGSHDIFEYDCGCIETDGHVTSYCSVHWTAKPDVPA